MMPLNTQPAETRAIFLFIHLRQDGLRRAIMLLSWAYLCPSLIDRLGHTWHKNQGRQGFFQGRVPRFPPMMLNTCTTCMYSTIAPQHSKNKRSGISLHVYFCGPNIVPLSLFHGRNTVDHSFQTRMFPLWTCRSQNSNSEGGLHVI